MHMNTHVCAIMVTYRSAESVAEVVQALLAQVKCVYIIDNGSYESTREKLQQCRSDYPDRIQLVLNDGNIGLAAAQNQGIRQALAARFEWILLIDDDSMPQTDMIGRLLAVWRARDDARIGILAPRIVERNVPVASRYLVPWCRIGFRRKKLQMKECLSDAAMVIASGSLIRAEVFHRAGLMNEGFFIDSVDHEFCLRARRSGYTILVAGDSVLFHRQGNKRRHALLGIIPVITSGHSAGRRYYIFRNRLFLLRRYGRHFPFLLPHEAMACAIDAARILLFETAKKEKLASAWRGLAHGWLHNIPADTEI